MITILIVQYSNYISEGNTNTHQEAVSPGTSRPDGILVLLAEKPLRAREEGVIELEAQLETHREASLISADGGTDPCLEGGVLSTVQGKLIGVSTSVFPQISPRAILPARIELGEELMGAVISLLHLECRHEIHRTN